MKTLDHTSARRRKQPAPSLNSARSAVSNGTVLIPNLDHRSAWARRLRDLVNDQLACLGPDDQITEFERLLVRRSSMLSLQLELIEQEWSQNEDGRGTPFQLDLYQRLLNSNRRTIEVLAAGDARPRHDPLKARDVTNSAHAVLRSFRTNGGAEP